MNISTATARHHASHGDSTTEHEIRPIATDWLARRYGLPVSFATTIAASVGFVAPSMEALR